MRQQAAGADKAGGVVGMAVQRHWVLKGYAVFREGRGGGTVCLVLGCQPVAGGGEGRLKGSGALEPSSRVSSVQRRSVSTRVTK